MNVMGDFTAGLLSVLRIAGGSMLYRYPYRISAEGLKSDWQNIGKDIESAVGRLDMETHYE